MIHILPKLTNLEPQRREAIINAALKEFAVKGYDDASTNVIAREAGMSKALFFHYVGSKKELFLYLFDYCCKIMENETREYQELIKKERDVFARVRLGLHMKKKLLYQNFPYVYAFYVVAAYTETEQFKEYFTLQNTSLFKNITEQMYEGIDKSRFKEDIDIQKAVLVICLTSEGFAYGVHNKINIRKGFRIDQMDLDKYFAEYDSCLALLEKSFYR